jgi:hypothetical protein
MRTRTSLATLLLLAACSGTEGNVILPFRDGGSPAEDAAGGPTDAASGEDATAATDGGGGDASAPAPDAGPASDALPGTDAAPAPDAAVVDGGAPEIDCRQVPPVFPRFDRSCSSAMDCALGEVQINCCGSMAVTGIAAGELARFQAAAAICASQFPGCGCPTMPTIADDGTSNQGIPATVSCENNVCTSSFPPPRTPCGQTTCDATTEICVASFPHGPAIDYQCQPIPAGCEGDRSCRCAAATLCVAPFNLCTDAGPNQISCECPVCQ